MARFELKLPKMGESIAEATITNWLKQVGEKIEIDEAVVEIATDKVDSEIPCEVSGILVEQLFKANDLVQVGQTIAIIETQSGANSLLVDNDMLLDEVEVIEKDFDQVKETLLVPVTLTESDGDMFLSPLVKNIAKEEGISVAELQTISGTGKEGRVTKTDVLDYIKNKKNEPAPVVAVTTIADAQLIAPTTSEPITNTPIANTPISIPVSINGGDEVIEMDRMRKLISGYMIASIQTSAHVQSFVEVDVTTIVKWRERVKNVFEKREGEKLTFTPIFMEAVAKALKDFPDMNISVNGNYIIKKRNINLGMAAALPNGNLIVPVIKNADQLNLVGMAKAVNDLGDRAKAGKLRPNDTQDGTFTVSNVGIFGSVFGTPIINQPQVGIIALGAIRKVPAVIETPQGDFIGIRHKMFLSHSYDHRVVDGALGGRFVKRVADYLEAFDGDRDF